MKKNEKSNKKQGIKVGQYTSHMLQLGFLRKPRVAGLIQGAEIVWKEKEASNLTIVDNRIKRRLVTWSWRGKIGQGSWSWNLSLEDSIRRRIRFGFPLKLERFWP